MSKIIFRKKAQIVWIAVCAVMVLLTIFLVTLSIMFSGGRSASDLFGSNLYLVRSDAFTLIPAPSVVIGERVTPSELNPGHIVIFETQDGRTSIGEIVEVGVSAPPDLSEDNSEPPEVEPLYLLLQDETGESLIVAGSAIVSKAVRTSRFLGFIFNFASSPLGVLFIAVIPCVCIILGEVFKPLLFKNRATVVPVNKQDESPTFVSVGKAEPPKPLVGDALARPEPPPEPPPSEPTPEPLVPESPLVTFKPESPVGDSLARPKPTVNYAALKAYKDTLGAAQETAPAPELITAPEQVAPAPTPAVNSANQKKKPLSSVKLAEVIAAANAEREKQEQEAQAKADVKIETKNEDKEGELKPWVMPKRKTEKGE